MLPQLLSVFILKKYLSFFSNVEKKISREREMRADHVAASLAGNGPLGSALKKIYGFGGLWSLAADNSLLDSLSTGRLYSNFCASFVDYARGHPALIEALLDNSIYTPPHPLDTYPQLKTRLSELGVSHEFNQPIRAGLKAASPGDDLAIIEEQLTMFETQALAKQSGHA